MRDRLFSRIAMTLLLATTATVSFAQTMYKDAPMYKGMMPMPCPNLMCGFYVGAQAGYDSYRIGTSIDGPGGSFSNRASATGWLGGLFVGYGQYFNNQFYLGGELLGNYSGADQTFASGADDDGDSFNRRAKVYGTWGVALIPGIKLNNATLGFIRLGWDWTRIKHSLTVVNGGGPTTSLSNTHTYNGFDFGIGLETLICGNWSVRTQYDHVWYNNHTNNVGDGVSIETRPSNNLFTLGLIYHIA